MLKSQHKKGEVSYSVVLDNTGGSQHSEQSATANLVLPHLLPVKHVLMNHPNYETISFDNTRKLVVNRIDSVTIKMALRDMRNILCGGVLIIADNVTDLEKL